jgi:hypothetical protein
MGASTLTYTQLLGRTSGGTRRSQLFRMEAIVSLWWKTERQWFSEPVVHGSFTQSSVNELSVDQPLHRLLDLANMGHPWALVKNPMQIFTGTQGSDLCKKVKAGHYVGAGNRSVTVMGTPPEGHRDAMLFDSPCSRKKRGQDTKPWEWRIFHILKMRSGTNPIFCIFCTNWHPDFRMVLGRPLMVSQILSLPSELINVILVSDCCRSATKDDKEISMSSSESSSRSARDGSTAG